MDKNKENNNDNDLQHRGEFETVYGIIFAHNEKKSIVPIIGTNTKLLTSVRPFYVRKNK